jgi:nucleotide-binding universal stress UspA family protein
MALELAASIAKKNDARLFIMHIIQIPTYETNTSIESYEDVAEGLFIMKMVKQKFEELMKKPYLEEVNVIELIQFDSVYESISRQAAEQEIDMIIMGSHGASGAKELVIGSNAERIIRTSPIPVLTVKTRFTEFNPQKIVFASNFYGESADNFYQVKRFADMFGSKIHLLKVNTPNQFETTKFSEKLIEDFVKETGLSNYDYAIYNDENVEDGIHHYCNKIDADLIAMETHGRTGIAHFLAGSVTEGVANHTELPVFSVRIKKNKEKEGVIFPD